MCVCVREREREKELFLKGIYIYIMWSRMDSSDSKKSQIGRERSSATTNCHVAIFVAMTVTIVPILLFVLCYVFVWLTGYGPVCMKSFIAKMLRVVKGGDMRSWNVTFLKDFGIAVGTIPSSSQHLSELKSKYKIRFVVTLNEPWEIANSTVLNHKMMKSCGLEWKIIPTPDYGPPSISAMIEMLRWFREKRKEGENVYFHCNAGQGRSATSAICMMMAMKNWSAERGYEELSSVRKISSMRGCCGHARTAHWHALKAWECYLSSNATTKNGFELSLASSV